MLTLQRALTVFRVRGHGRFVVPRLLARDVNATRYRVEKALNLLHVSSLLVEQLALSA